MRRKAFGKRKLQQGGTQVSNSAKSGLKTSDLVGLVVLSVLVFVVVDGRYYSGNSVNAFVDIICRVIEVPADFANDWVLRASLDHHHTSAAPVPLGMVVLPSLKSLIVAAHQASLIIGLGAAFFLDVYLARHLVHRRVTQQTLELVRFGSLLVAWGLAAIWMSGIAILVYYSLWSPELLQNPKILAKCVIVLVLTVNGVLIHNNALNHLRHCLGRSILDQPLNRVATAYLPLVATSVVSWGFAFALGAFKEINNVYEASELVGAFIVLLATFYGLLYVGVALSKQLRGWSLH